MTKLNHIHTSNCMPFNFFLLNTVLPTGTCLKCPCRLQHVCCTNHEPPKKIRIWFRIRHLSAANWALFLPIIKDLVRLNCLNIFVTQSHETIRLLVFRIAPALEPRPATSVVGLVTYWRSAQVAVAVPSRYLVLVPIFKLVATGVEF